MEINRSINLQKLLCLFPILDLISPLKADSAVPDYSLKFHHLAATWDEGIPLGNGALGALVWQ